jgi:hypothetical protein
VLQVQAGVHAADCCGSVAACQQLPTGPSRITAASTRRLNACASRVQGKAGKQALKNLRGDTVLEGLVNNLAITERMRGASGTVPNEQFHRVANARVPQESVTSMGTKLPCIQLAIYGHNGATLLAPACACCRWLAARVDSDVSAHSQSLPHAYHAYVHSSQPLARAESKAEVSHGRPAGRHRCDVAISMLSAAMPFAGGVQGSAEARAALKFNSTLMVCMPDDDSRRYRHKELCHLGFRIKQLQRSAWIRDEILRLARACLQLCNGSADRSEAIHDWGQWMATYVFAGTKDAYEVRLQIAKLVGMRASEPAPAE